MPRKPQEPGITLGVSRSVPPPVRSGTRVRYRIHGAEMIAEQVIRTRWIKGRPENRGHRLDPRIWAILGALLPHLPQPPASAMEEDVRAAYRKAKNLPTRSRPVVSVVALLRMLSEERLRKLIERHCPPDAADPLGVPDLLLFRVTRSFQAETRGRLYAPRFVEVKRPRERLLPRQLEEIRFLRGLGLRAGVVRLVERKPPTRRSG